MDYTAAMNTTTRTRLLPKERKAQVLAAAISACARHGWLQVTRAQIATEAGVSDGLVHHYLKDMAALRKTIMQHAVKHGLAGIVAQGLAVKNPVAMKAGEELKAEARKAI